MVKLIYKPEDMLSLCEYAARTCYNSHHSKKSTREELIQRLVNLGHESIIEHAQIILKVDKKRYTANTILRALNNTENNMNSSDVHASLVETKSYWYIGLNIRGLKNIIRNTIDKNLLRQDIIREIIPQLPNVFFSDFIRDGIIDSYSNVYGLNYPYPLFNENDKYDILSNMNHIEEYIEEILGKNPELSLLQLGKLITMTIRIKAPLPISEQLLRHRNPTSKQSLRYTDGYSTDYYVPPEFKTSIFKIAKSAIDIDTPQSNSEIIKFNYHTIMKLLKIAYNQANITYNTKREICRFMLPMATMTETVFTRTLAQWHWTFEKRISKAAQSYTNILMSEIYLLMVNKGYIDIDKLFLDLNDRIDYKYFSQNK